MATTSITIGSLQTCHLRRLAMDQMRKSRLSLIVMVEDREAAAELVNFQQDHEMSLRGPFGGVHNLDVRHISRRPGRTAQRR